MARPAAPNDPPKKPAAPTEVPSAAPVPVAPIESAGAAAPPAPVAMDPPRARRFVKHLPRAGLIVFVLAILVVCYSVLMPFLLAVFFAYLIYPVVSRLERIRVANRHAPRWLAVITVYAILFTIGWNTIPPLVNNFMSQVRKLGQDAPGLFESVKNQRKRLDVWMAERLEVTELNEVSRKELFDEVEALQKGTIVPAPAPEGAPLIPPPEPARAPADAKDDAAARPTVVQIIAININGGPSPAPAAKGSAESDGAAGDGSSGHASPHGADPTPPTNETPSGEGDAPPERQLLFPYDVAIPFKTALKEQINAELKKPGPAKGLERRVEREIVPALNRRILGLRDDDPLLLTFARNAGILVQGAIAQEDYAALINRYSGAALDQARVWIQAQAAQVIPLGTGLASVVFDFFMILMLTAFFLVFFPRIRDYMRDLVSPQFRDDYGKVLLRIDKRLSGAIRGQVIICLINASLTFPGLWIIGTHSSATTVATYSVLLSVMAGVLSMIPIFGVILSTVPMVILALTQHSVYGALLVIMWISVIHAIEAYLLNPNILGHSASMNPIIVVFALLAGKQFGGLTGALLAVPIASVIVSLFGYYRRLVAENYATETGAAVPVDDWDD
jgi:predicted PurR-regulated permease PerM